MQEETKQKILWAGVAQIEFVQTRTATGLEIKKMTLQPTLSYFEAGG